MRMTKRGETLILAAWLGLGATALLIVLRVLQLPMLLDVDTGLLSLSTGLIVLPCLVLAVLAWLCRGACRERVEVCDSATAPVALVTMLAGGVLAVSSLWELFSWRIFEKIPAPETAQLEGLALPLLWLYLLCGVAGGVALVAFGGQVASEGGTRIGMSSFPLLLPVVWMWFRLARYEMSYASAVRLSESFFDFAMLVFEILLLFKLARFASGIGSTRPGMLVFYGLGAGMFGVGGPLVRLCMYLLGDTQAYQASGLAGGVDFVLGLMAFFWAFALAKGQCVGAAEGEASSSEEDAEGSEPLFLIMDTKRE